MIRFSAIAASLVVVVTLTAACDAADTAMAGPQTGNASVIQLSQPEAATPAPTNPGNSQVSGAAGDANNANAAAKPPTIQHAIIKLTPQVQPSVNPPAVPAPVTGAVPTAKPTLSGDKTNPPASKAPATDASNTSPTKIDSATPPPQSSVPTGPMSGTKPVMEPTVPQPQTSLPPHQGSTTQQPVAPPPSANAPATPPGLNLIGAGQPNKGPETVPPATSSDGGRATVPSPVPMPNSAPGKNPPAGTTQAGPESLSFNPPARSPQNLPTFGPNTGAGRRFPTPRAFTRPNLPTPPSPTANGSATPQVPQQPVPTTAAKPQETVTPPAPGLNFQRPTTGAALPPQSPRQKPPMKINLHVGNQSPQSAPPTSGVWQGAAGNAQGVTGPTGISSPNDGTMQSEIAAPIQQPQQ